MSSTAAKDAASTQCANCSKAEVDEIKLKPCSGCKMVKYCSRDCQAEHRPQHKMACKKRAAELFEEELFKDHPERGECPICMLTLPADPNEIMFKVCCGKHICCGCMHAQCKEDIRRGKDIKEIGVCPFCRAPQPQTDEEAVLQLRKSAATNNPHAICILADLYMRGGKGVQRDSAKALRLYRKACEFGSVNAYCDLGVAYQFGMVSGTEDTKKTRKYFELGAIGGSVSARYNLACSDWNDGNHERAYKHILIGAKAGCKDCLEKLKPGFVEGYITKDEYTCALRAYQKQRDDTKSVMRDEAIHYNANPSLYYENS